MSKILCVWQGTVVGKDSVQEFEKWFKEEFDVEAKYLEEVQTLAGNGGEGGRNDVFFEVDSDNQNFSKFCLSRLQYGIRWFDDVMNSDKKLYKKDILKKYLKEDSEEAKPECKLVGTDGNVFAIIGNVSKTLKRAGLRDKAEEFSKKAMSQKSYEDVLALVHNYVSVC